MGEMMLTMAAIGLVGLMAQVAQVRGAVVVPPPAAGFISPASASARVAVNIMTNTVNDGPVAYARCWGVVNGAFNTPIDPMLPRLSASGPIIQWECNGAQDQAWWLEPTDHADCYYIRSGGSSSGLCLGLGSGAATSWGADLSMTTCQAAYSQSFCFSGDLFRPDLGYTIAPSNNGRSPWMAPDGAEPICVDIEGGVVRDGAPLQVWGCNKTPAQVFHLVPVDQYRFGRPPQGAVGPGSGSKTFKIITSTVNPVPVTYQRCLGVAGGATTTSGSRVVQANCKAGAPDQRWYAQEAWQGTAGAKCYTFRSGGSNGLCMDLGPNTGNGQDVTINTCQTAKNSQIMCFGDSYPAGGYYIWFHLAGPGVPSGRCWDIEGGLVDNNTPLQVWDCNRTPAQRFYLVQDSNTGPTPCARPGSGWCGQAGSTASNVDCDKDGADDWACIASSGVRSVILSTKGCVLNTNVRATACPSVFASNSKSIGTQNIAPSAGSFAFIVTNTHTLIPGYTDNVQLKCWSAKDQQYQSSGTPVVQLPCLGGQYQRWFLQAAGGNCFSMRAGNKNGLCLDIQGSGTAEGTLAQLKTCTSAANQQFCFQGTASGGYVVVPKYLSSSNRCMDVRGADIADNAPIWTWSCNQSAAQVVFVRAG